MLAMLAKSRSTVLSRLARADAAAVSTEYHTPMGRNGRVSMGCREACEHPTTSAPAQAAARANNPARAHGGPDFLPAGGTIHLTRAKPHRYTWPAFIDGIGDLFKAVILT